MSEWISVNDRLPKNEELVLCVGKKGGMFIGSILNFAKDNIKEVDSVYVHVPNSRSGRYAVYWMPLPEPPKE